MGVVWPLGYALELLGLSGLAMDLLRVGKLVTPLLSQALSKYRRRPKQLLIPLPYLFSLFPVLFLLLPFAVTQTGSLG